MQRCCVLHAFCLLFAAALPRCVQHAWQSTSLKVACSCLRPASPATGWQQPVAHAARPRNPPQAKQGADKGGASSLAERVTVSNAARAACQRLARRAIAAGAAPMAWVPVGAPGPVLPLFLDRVFELGQAVRQGRRPGCISSRAFCLVFGLQVCTCARPWHSPANRVDFHPGLYRSQRHELRDGPAGGCGRCGVGRRLRRRARMAHCARADLQVGDAAVLLVWLLCVRTHAAERLAQRG